MTNLTFGVDEKKLSADRTGFFRNLRLHAVYSEPDQMRVYPNGSLAAQVIGFPAIEETKVDGHYRFPNCRARRRGTGDAETS